MRGLRQSLIQHSSPLLEEVARYWGLPLVVRSPEQGAADLAAHMLTPAVFKAMYESLSPAARAALHIVATFDPPMAWPTFVRRWGPVRDLGPRRLLREQPWRAPLSPGEELVYRCLVFRTTTQLGDHLAEVVYVPDDIRLLLSEEDAPRRALAIPTQEPPDIIRQSGHAFINDLTMLLAFAYNEGLEVDWEGLPLRAPLARLGERFIVPLEPTALHRPPARVHLLFHHARTLGLLYQEGNRLRVHGKRLARWLKQPIAYQRLIVWRAWAESKRWHDLTFVSALQCVSPIAPGDPVGARERVLRHLHDLTTNAWYRIEDLIAWMHEHDPDFLRPDGDYQQWVIREAETGEVLRGFESWERVEGRLVHFYLTGPLFWLGGVMVDAEGTRFALTEAGYRWLRRRSEPIRRERPRLIVSANFRIRFPHTVHPFDHFRVARFADWEASRPEYVYRITEASLARARTQGLSRRQILEFLRKAGGGKVPVTLWRTLQR